MNQKKKHRDFCIDKYKLNRLYYGTKSQKRRSSIVQKRKGKRACLNDQHGRKTTRVSIGTGKTKKAAEMEAAKKALQLQND